MSKVSGLAALVAGGAIVTAVFLESPSNSSAQTKTRYLPEYTASGDAVLPFRNWVTSIRHGDDAMASLEISDAHLRPGTAAVQQRTS